MILDPDGETLIYHRRVEGADNLLAIRTEDGPDAAPILVASGREPVRAFAARDGLMLVCCGWPRSPGGPSFRVMDLRRVTTLLRDDPARLNQRLTAVPVLAGFGIERRSLPVEVFELLRGTTVQVPGLMETGNGGWVPALYEVNGRDATFHVAPLSFLEPGALPTAAGLEPGGQRVWLTVGDSNHAFILNAESLELVDDRVWAVEETALARVSFHNSRREAWVSALTSLFIWPLDRPGPPTEIEVCPELRWQRGEMARGLVGACCFSTDGLRALVARPLSGDLVELDVETRSVLREIPVALDPLELLHCPRKGRVYFQGMRNGQIGWMPYG